jgi:hypothetical protein
MAGFVSTASSFTFIRKRLLRTTHPHYVRNEQSLLLLWLKQPNTTTTMLKLPRKGRKRRELLPQMKMKKKRKTSCFLTRART